MGNFYNKLLLMGSMTLAATSLAPTSMLTLNNYHDMNIRNLVKSDFTNKTTVINQIKTQLTTTGKIYETGILNPLSRIYGIQMDQASYATVTIKAKLAQYEDITYTVNKDNLQSQLIIPILYLYQNYQNQVIITINGSNDNTIAIKTLSISTIKVLNQQSAILHLPIVGQTKQINQYLFFPTGSNQPNVAYDKDGEIRWAMPQESHQLPAIINDSNISLGINFLNTNPKTAVEENYYSRSSIDIDWLGLASNRAFDFDNYGGSYDTINTSNHGQIIITNRKDFINQNVPRQDTLLQFKDNQNVPIEHNMTKPWTDITKNHEPLYKMFHFLNDDWIHLNAISAIDDNHVLVSARDLDTIYQYNLQTKKIDWLMTGSTSLLNALDQNFLALNHTKVIALATKDAIWGQHSIKFISHDDANNIKFILLDNQYPVESIAEYDAPFEFNKNNSYFKEFTINLEHQTYQINSIHNVDKVTFRGNVKLLEQNTLEYSFSPDSGNVEFYNPLTKTTIFKKYFGGSVYNTLYRVTPFKINPNLQF